MRRDRNSNLRKSSLVSGNVGRDLHNVSPISFESGRDREMSSEELTTDDETAAQRFPRAREPVNRPPPTWRRHEIGEITYFLAYNVLESWGLGPREKNYFSPFHYLYRYFLLRSIAASDDRSSSHWIVSIDKCCTRDSQQLVRYRVLDAFRIQPSRVKKKEKTKFCQLLPPLVLHFEIVQFLRMVFICYLTLNYDPREPSEKKNQAKTK